MAGMWPGTRRAERRSAPARCRLVTRCEPPKPCPPLRRTPLGPNTARTERTNGHVGRANANCECERSASMREQPARLPPVGPLDPPARRHYDRRWHRTSGVRRLCLTRLMCLDDAHSQDLAATPSERSHMTQIRVSRSGMDRCWLPRERLHHYASWDSLQGHRMRRLLSRC